MVITTSLLCVCVCRSVDSTQVMYDRYDNGCHFDRRLPSIVYYRVASVLARIADDCVYYLLHGSTLRLLLLLLWICLILLCRRCSSSISFSRGCCCWCWCSLVTNTLLVVVSFVCQSLLLHYDITLCCGIFCRGWMDQVINFRAILVSLPCCCCQWWWWWWYRWKRFCTNTRCLVFIGIIIIIIIGSNNKATTQE